jgi:hypothetical protein
MVETMNEQLLLLRLSLLGSHEQPWRLDDHTREIGRRGIEEARAALRRVAADECRPAPRRTAA